ncbi:cohesin domain-containing protein [Desulfobacterales bacterium HSG2]|nr:cohesin domain-containing protein [Desulfobacterales bacterium HSG2]
MSVKLVCLVIYGVTTIFSASAAWGTELSVPAIKAKAGESVDIPVMVDFVDNLAGIKLVMKYDTDILTFKKANKTKHTSSLMHIVNDKKPGSLVVVMAGARGIKGKDFPILSLKFELKKGLKKDSVTKLKVVKLQMMSDQLKDIKCNVKINPLTVLSGRSGAKKSGRSDAKTEQAAPESGQTAAEQAAPKDAPKPEQIAEQATPKSGRTAAEQVAPKDVPKPEQIAEQPAPKSGRTAAEQVAPKDVPKPEQIAEQPAPKSGQTAAEQAAPKDAAPKPEQSTEQVAPKSGQRDERPAPKSEQSKGESEPSVKKKAETVRRTRPCPLTIPTGGLNKKSESGKCGQDAEKPEQDAKK